MPPQAAERPSEFSPSWFAVAHLMVSLDRALLSIAGKRVPRNSSSTAQVLASARRRFLNRRHAGPVFSGTARAAAWLFHLLAPARAPLETGPPPRRSRLSSTAR